MRHVQRNIAISGNMSAHELRLDDGILTFGMADESLMLRVGGKALEAPLSGDVRRDDYHYPVLACVDKGGPPLLLPDAEPLLCEKDVDVLKTNGEETYASDTSVADTEWDDCS